MGIKKMNLSALYGVLLLGTLLCRVEGGFMTKKCANGCDKPVKAPSKVLCEDCLAQLDVKFHNLFQKWAKHDDERKTKIWEETGQCTQEKQKRG